MVVPKNKVLQAARKQKNLLIKILLYYIFILFCFLDWLLNRNEHKINPPIGDVVDLTINKNK